MHLQECTLWCAVRLAVPVCRQAAHRDVQERRQGEWNNPCRLVIGRSVTFHRHAPDDLLVGRVNIEPVLIVVAVRLRNRAEDTVSLAAGDDPYIIVLVLFEAASAVLFDGRAGCGRLGVRGEVPVPGAGRIGSQEYIVAVGAVDDIPVELDVFGTGKLRGNALGPGRDEDDVGPGAVGGDIPAGIHLDRADLRLIDMLVIQVRDLDAVVVAGYIAADIVGSVGPYTSNLVVICS